MICKSKVAYGTKRYSPSSEAVSGSDDCRLTDQSSAAEPIDLPVRIGLPDSDHPRIGRPVLDPGTSDNRSGLPARFLPPATQIQPLRHPIHGSFATNVWHVSGKPAELPGVNGVACFAFIYRDAFEFLFVASGLLIVGVEIRVAVRVSVVAEVERLDGIFDETRFRDVFDVFR